MAKEIDEDLPSCRDSANCTAADTECTEIA
jgi:hypothetical protein